MTTAKTTRVRKTRASKTPVVAPIIHSKWVAADFSLKFNSTELLCWAKDVIGIEPPIDPESDEYAEFLDRVSDFIPDDHADMPGLITKITTLKTNLATFHPEQYVNSLSFGLRHSVWRSLANTAIMRMITAVCPANGSSEFGNLPPLEAYLYKLALDNIPCEASEYDKPMSFKAAVLLLIQDRVPADEIVETLASVTGISASMLTNLALTDSKRRTERFKKSGVKTIEHVSDILAVQQHSGLLSIVEQHNVMGRIVRALNKTRQSALRRMLNTGSLDQLGVFPLCDAEMIILHSRMQDIELSHYDEIEGSEYRLTADGVQSEYLEAMPLAK